MQANEAWSAAVMSGDVEGVRRLLRAAPDPAALANARVFAFDSPALFHCRGNLPLVDELLAHGADINLKTGWGPGGFGILEGIDPALAEPLIRRGAVVDIWSAVHLNRTADVTRLLDERPERAVARGGDGKHPLHYARDAAMVDLLVARGADVDARDVDHTSTPLQYLVGDPAVARRLIDHGARVDVFAAAALGNPALVARCVAEDPAAADARLGCPPWTNDAGGFFYNWSLGHDVTPLDVARERGHDAALELLLEACSPRRRLTDAIWNGDEPRVREVLGEPEDALFTLTDDDRQLLARAAWWYRPRAVEIMLRLGFVASFPGVHNSTPLDRAAFHGYADIVERLLRHELNPPLEHLNAFGGTPLGTCLYGFRHGWDTGHPRDHRRTVELLLDAGAHPDPDWPPTGDPELDRLLASAD